VILDGIGLGATIDVRMNDHPVTTLAASQRDIKARIVVLQEANDLAIFS
jgi:hypothetical protein